MRRHTLHHPPRHWLTMVPEALLACALTVASLSVFLQTEQIEVAAAGFVTPTATETTFKG